jgi:hypothetical protein
MIRRWFRRGLTFGALAGVGFGLAKLLRPHDDDTAPVAAPPAPREPWPPLTERAAPPREPTPVAAPVVPDPVPEPAPAPAPAPAAEPEELVEEEAPEPVSVRWWEEPVRAPAAAPAKKVSAKKTVVKVTKKAAAKPAAAKATKRTLKAAAAAWVDPEGGICPTTHPVKAKLSSKIFHVKGGMNYERTVPERCYRDPAAAEADGFRRSKM